MKLQSYLLICLLFFCGTILAQDSPQGNNKEGDVKVYQDDAIKNLIGSPGNNNTNNTTTPSDNKGNSAVSEGDSAKTLPYEEKRGNYRILVFSGNDQKRSKKEAFSKRDMVKGRFPSMSVDVKYDSPYWKVRAGFYASKTDAEAALHLLKNAFPGFGGEMYIIRVAKTK